MKENILPEQMNKRANNINDQFKWKLIMQYSICLSYTSVLNNGNNWFVHHSLVVSLLIIINILVYQFK